MQLHGEQQDHQYAQKERGHRAQQQCQHRRAAIRHGVFFHRGNNAHGNADNRADQHGQEGQLRRGGELGHQHLKHRLAVFVALAKIALERVQHIIDELHRHGIVIAQLLVQQLHLLLRGVDAQNNASGRVGDKLQNRKNNENHEQQRRDHHQQPPENVFTHEVSPLRCYLE